MGFFIASPLIIHAFVAAVLLGVSGIYLAIRYIESEKKPLKAKHEDYHHEYYQEFSQEHASNTQSRSSVSLDKDFNNADPDDMFSVVSSEIDAFSVDSLIEEDENVEALFAEVDNLLPGTEVERLLAYSLLMKNRPYNNANPDFLWRIAKTFYFIANIRDDKETRKQLIKEGMAYADAAISLNPKDCEAHKWFAVLIGMKAELGPVKDKIRLGLLFYDNLCIALSVKPNDATVHHLLGRFKYEIASLNPFTRKMGSMCAALPNFTMQDALEHFESAKKFRSDWIENNLYLCKCYMAMKDILYAKYVFNKTRNIIPVTPEDITSKKELLELMKSY